MQCVLICAGKGTRMRPLTDTIPKPLIKICGRPILEHIVSALPEIIDELVLVVGYKQEQIRAYCGEEFIGRKVTYVEQKDFAGGTGDALMCAKDLVKGKFLFMYADDIHGAEALARAVECDHGILGMESDTPELFGVLMLNKDGSLKEIIEKPEKPESNLVNIGGFVVTPEIFSYDVKVSNSGELYATDMLNAYANDYSVEIIRQDTWLPIGYPEHIEKAEAILCPDRIDHPL
jgi:NDP-sugar pyrophosphorylase family protein